MHILNRKSKVDQFYGLAPPRAVREMRLRETRAVFHLARAACAAADGTAERAVAMLR